MSNPVFRIVLAGIVAVAGAMGGCDRRQSGAAAAGAPAAAPVPLRLDSAVVIGASVSAGAEVSLPGMPPKMFGGDANLADALAAITDGPAPRSLADMMFFVSANKTAEKQLDAAKASNPAIVFAIDYLFWHAYGEGMNDDQRRKLFERGLSRLATLECPVVIADLPDMSHAIGQMLMKEQVPPPALLAELNSRLDAWVHGRSNIILVPLRDAVAKAMASQPVSLGGHSFEGAASRALLVKNGLHTTADGLICVALECLDRARDAGAIPANRRWETDVGAIRQRLVDTKLASLKAKQQGGAAPGTVGAGR